MRGTYVIINKLFRKKMEVKMKNLTSKIFKSTISVLIVVSMLMGMCTTLFAEGGDSGDDKKINYVSIGDSMANGYCFEGYEQGHNVSLDIYDFLKGLGMYGKDAYPNQFEAYLKGIYGADNVSHTKLAPSAMLAEDLLYLLDGREEIDDGWGGFKDYVGPYRDTPEGIEKIKEHIQTAVTEADIMTVGIGNASFGAFLLDRITSALGVFGASLDEDEMLGLEEALALLENEEAKQTILEIYDELKAEILAYKDFLPEGWQLEAAVDIIVYTAASFLVNYEALLDRIIEMNPDCEIILVGLMNTTYGMTVTGDFEDVPLGDIMDGMFSLLNAYIAGVPVAKQAAGEYADAVFYYAEQPNPLFISQEFDNLYKEGWNAIDCGDENCTDCTDGDPSTVCVNGRLSGKIVRDRTIAAYNSSVAGMIAGMFGIPEKFFTIEASNIADYESRKHWSEKGDYANLPIFTGSGVDYKDLSVVIYLSLEKAIAESVDTMAIPLDGLMKIAGNLESVFSSVSLPDIGGPNGATSEKIREVFTDFFCSDDLKPLVKVFALFKAGNGMSVHPTPAGHDNIAKAVIEAYENKWTVQDETLANAEEALNIVLGLIEEYYDDAYAYAYQYAYENGYIDIVGLAIILIELELDELDFSDTQMTEAFREELEAEIDEILDLLDAAYELLYAADELDEEALDALMVLLAEAEEALEGLLYVLEQAGIDTYELVIAPAIEKALYELENTIIPAAKELAKEIAKEAHAYLVEALAEAYEHLKVIIAEAAKKYLPELADAIYNYLYNNPEEVIEFVVTYGPYVLDVMEEYGDEALVVLGYVLSFYGEDIAAFIIENHETILANMIAWMEVHGENTAKLIQVYAEALGLCDAVREQIAELEALLEEIKAAYEEAEAKEMLDEIIAQIEAQIAILEAKIEELKAELAEVIADVKELIAEGKEIVAQKVAELKAAVAELKAEVEAAIEELKAEAEAVIAEVVAQLEAILEAEINNLEDLVNAVEAKVTEAVDTIIILVEEIIYYATHGVYIIEDESYYLALGDSTAVGDSYVEMLVEYLDMVDEYNNLAIDDITAEELLALMTDEYMISEILRADLITLSMSNNTFTVFAANQIAAYLTGRPTVDLIWENYLPEEAIDVLNEKLSEIYLSFLEAGLDEKMAFVATYAIENFLYAYASYMFSYVAIVATIHEINPDALVVLVGMSNTFDGIVMDLDGSDLAIGEYVEYLVAVANIESFALAVAGENTIYVDAPDVETDFDAEEVDFLGFITEIVLYGAETLYPNAAGQEYIFGQIVESLEVYDNRGLLGDADGNGIVDMFDASLILQYYTQEIKEEDIYLFVSDVDGNGEVDMFDASLVLQYYTGEIDVFPVEE